MDIFWPTIYVCTCVMPTELSFVCVLTHHADDGMWWFMMDDDESCEKARKWGLAEHVRVPCRWSLDNYVGKRVRVVLRCAVYRFRGDGDVLREGMRPCAVSNIKLNDR